MIPHLDALLSDLVVKDEVSQCENVHCTNQNHLEATDDLIIGILESIDKAASENLHNVFQKSAERKCQIPGWTDAVKPFKDNAFFWHQIWQSAGRPIYSQLHCTMKRTRSMDGKKEDLEEHFKGI